MEVINRGLAALGKYIEIILLNGVRRNCWSDRNGWECFSTWKVCYKSLSTKKWTDLDAKKQDVVKYVKKCLFLQLWSTLASDENLHGIDKYPPPARACPFLCRQFPFSAANPALNREAKCTDEIVLFLFIFWLCPPSSSPPPSPPSYFLRFWNI